MKGNASNLRHKTMLNGIKRMELSTFAEPKNVTLAIIHNKVHEELIAEIAAPALLLIVGT